MTRVFGWWDADVDLGCLVNRETRQRLTYAGPAADDSILDLRRSPNRYWMRFDYEDREVLYPLLIEWRSIPRDRHPRGRPIVWRIDHIRSAALWRRETGSDAGYPSYGLWRRVDDCLCETLTVWPALDVVGSVPQEIAINGGWLNGRWSADLFRRVQRLANDRDLPDNETRFPAWMIDLATEAPSPWAFVPATGIDDSATLREWGFVQLADQKMILPPDRNLHGVERSRPYLQSADGRRALVLLDPSRCPPGLVMSHKQHLLYVDEDMVCDALTTGLGTAKRLRGIVEEGFTFESSTAKLGEGKCGFAVRRDAAPADLFVLGISPHGHGVSTWYPSPALWMRLSWAVRDAWSVWPSISLSLFDDARAERLSMSKPHPDVVNTYGRSDSVHRLGMPRTRIECATSLAASAIGVRPDFAYMFDDARDGILRVESRTKLAGWWDFDPERPALINRKSGQRIVFTGTVDGVDRIGSRSSPTQLFSFTYEDNELRYPLLVDQWCLDHRLSAEVWRRNANRSEQHPPYGLWRRVDDCAADAFLCWPEIEATGPKDTRCSLAGAWLNGKWDGGALRTLHVDPEDLRKVGDGTVAEPILLPLDSSSPPGWVFYDVPEIARSASFTHAEQRPHKFSLLPSKAPLLPAGAPLTGFEQYVPHLRRSDGSAVLFPSRLDSYHSKSRRSVWMFIYADDDIVVELMTRGDWHFWFAGAKFSVRHDGGLARVLVDDDTSSSPPLEGIRRPLQPSYDLWRRLLSAIVEGGLAWSGTAGRMTADPKSDRNGKRDYGYTSLGLPHRALMYGCYVAGAFVQLADVAAEDGARRTEAERRARMPDTVTPSLMQVVDVLKRERREAAFDVVYRWGRERPLSQS